MTDQSLHEDLPPPRGRAARDALIAGAVVLAGGLVFTRLDAVESVVAVLRRFEGFELDDWLLTSCLAVAAATWFALRRLADSERRLRALQSSEAINARYVTRLEQLSAQLLETEQDERERLAEALHDSVSQTLYACGLTLDRASARVHEAEAALALREARGLLDAALASTRDLTSELSPPILHDLGLFEAIGWLLEQSNARYAIEARLVPGDGWARIPERWHAPVFHSVKELVINAGKHAGTRKVVVSAEARGDASVRVSVLDDGRGFAVGHAEGRGFGLFSVERRMACMGAELQIESAPDAGTRATLLLPCGP